MNLKNDYENETENLQKLQGDNLTQQRSPLIYENERIDEINKDLRLIQKKNGLTFGTDAYLLYAFAREQKKSVAADFGSGTGICALLNSASGKFRKIYAVEVQKDFANLIERNIDLNKETLKSEMQVINKDLRDLRYEDFSCELDVVFTNPPYMKNDSGKANIHEEKNIARHEIFGSIFDFCKIASKRLKFGGVFYCVYRPDRLSDLMYAMKENNLEPKRLCMVHSDTNTQPSMVLIEGKKGASSSMEVTAPLIVYENSEDKTSARKYTKRMQMIYDTGTFFKE